MDSHDAADVPRQIFPAGCDCEVVLGVGLVQRYHIITIFLIEFRGFTSTVLEELGQTLLFDLVDGFDVEPVADGWRDV